MSITDQNISVRNGSNYPTSHFHGNTIWKRVSNIITAIPRRSKLLQGRALHYQVRIKEIYYLKLGAFDVSSYQLGLRAFVR